MDRKHAAAQLELHAQQIMRILQQIEPRDFGLTITIDSQGEYQASYYGKGSMFDSGTSSEIAGEAAAFLVDAWHNKQQS